MPLESTMICVDNSEFMRNGDYVPTRLQAQQDAVNTVCRYKLLANPENNVGLLTLANTEVLATLTTDAGKILTSLHKVQPSGFINLLTGIRIAHLALKHRQSKNHKMRIVVFVGSPIEVEEKEVVKIAKRLKKENVNLDVINFGETHENEDCLSSMVSTINGREGVGSHLVTIPPSPHLAEALLSSPIIQGEDGTGPTNFGSGGGFEFGVDPNEDPELALALRVSMEEQRQRQQEEERRTNTDQPASGDAATPATTVSTTAPPTSTTTTTNTTAPSSTPASATSGGGASEEEMLRQALAMSLEPGVTAASEGGSAPTSSAPATVVSTPPAAPSSGGFPDFSSMTEEEQIAYAMQISLEGCQAKEDPEPMDIDKNTADKDSKAASKGDSKIEPDQDFSEVMADPAFLENVLNSLPGVNPQSKVVKQAVEQAVGSLGQDKKDKKKDSKEEEDKDKK